MNWKAKLGNSCGALLCAGVLLVGTTLALAVPGDNCGDPITVILPDDLDYSTSDSTCGRMDYYNGITCLGSYDSGEDIIYELVVTEQVSVNIIANGDTTQIGMALDGGCPPGDPCMENDTYGPTVEILNVVLDPGVYFLMIDTYAPPNCVTFDLSITENPIAVCCLSDGGCVDTIEVDCNSMGGIWQGAGSTCATAGGLCGLDCNNTETPDIFDIAYGLSEDLNGNDVPDECDLFGIGDFDGDCDVDLADYAILTTCFGGPIGSGCEQGDFNHDGLIDLPDYANFAGLLDGSGPGYSLPNCLPLPLGVDLFESSGILHLDIPPDFFEPGSDPFVGDVAMEADPINTSGAFELGTTNTVTERLSLAQLLDPVPFQQVFIEMVELSLVSVDPIVVYVEGIPELWDVSLSLSTNGPSHEGTLDLQNMGALQGSFNMKTPIVPIIRFEKYGEVRIMDPGETELVGTSGVWSPVETCSLTELAVPQLPVGLCLGIGMSSALLDLDMMPSMVDLGRPPAYVDPGAYVDPDVGCLGRFATISAGAYISAGAVIGPYAFIGPNVHVGENALVAEKAIVGESSILEPGAIVGSETELWMNVFVGENATIQGNCIIEQGASIGAGTRIGEGSFMGTWAEIGAFVTGGRELVICNDAIVADGLILPDTAQVDPGFYLTESLLTCLPSGGGSFVGTLDECEAAGAAVLELVLGLENEFTSAPVDRKVTPINPGSLPPELGDLADDVDSSGVAPANGGDSWTETTHDCDDFADELERYLQGKGYDATFTVIFDINPNRSWWQFWKPKLINGHAVTDIRQGGKVIWVEPQRSSAQGAVGIDMDADGDGKVEYGTGPGSSATDDSKRIEVYDSRKACEKAGRKLD